MVVAIVALIVALTGTAVGAAFITKKKAKKIANNQITKRAPGLSVKTAAGLADPSLQIRAWAKVNANGSLAASKNVTSVGHPSTGRYCFDLPFTPNSAVATVNADEAFQQDAVSFTVPDTGLCPAPTQDARAFTSDFNGTNKNVGFFVWFN